MYKLCRFLSIVTVAVGLGAAPGYAQAPNVFCVTSAKPLIIASEGLADRVGEIIYDCTGQPGTQVTANLAVQLNANITNRLSSGSTLTGIIFTIDTGAGPQAQTIPPLLMSPSELVYNGVNFTLSPKGTAELIISDIRANATQVGLNVPILAFLGVSHTSLALTSAQVTVGNPRRGLYSSQSSSIVCTQNGSRLPDTITFSNLITGGTVFASTRITEGFAAALQPRGGYANQNADSGNRIIVRYSGFPQGARLFVPDVVAGSDAVQPTAGGDFGVPASGGAYAVSQSGSLLLARVLGADTNGAGGGAVFNPAFASGTVHFDAVSEVQMTNGTAYVVYEVVDSDPSRFETAQFPTFLGLAPSGSGVASATTETVALAPLSNVSIATTSDPLPRFIPLAPPPDCGIIGDCGADYYPILSIQNTPFNYTAVTGTGFDRNYLFIHNVGAGVLQWSVSAVYPPGTPTGWLAIDPTQGLNNATVRVDAIAAKLQPGTYTATLVVDGGPLAGTQTFPVTFTVTAAPAPAPPPTPTVQVMSVVNAASFAPAPVVPGSLVSVMGTGFGGKSVGVTFDGKPAAILFSNPTQINLMTPELAANTTNMVVTVDGVSSAPLTVNVAPFAPAIFKGAVLNHDWTVNSVSHAEPAGGYVVIYATGLSGTGTVTARIGDRALTPLYAGPAPGFPGVQQINLAIPMDLPANTMDLSVCGAANDKVDAPVCSIAAPLTLK